MLSFAEETTSPPHKTENRGKRRATSEEISNLELLILLKEMRDEMKGRDEQLKEEHRWRDNHLDEENKRREV